MIAFRLYLPYIVAAMALAASAFAQATGTPLIKAYPRQAYGGATGQVFDGAQDNRGILYFTTADSGLLEFDGEHWRTNDTDGILLALAIDQQSRTWLAGPNRLGYFAAAGNAGRQWFDLTPLLSEQERAFSDTWPILPTDRGIFFGSREFLFRYRDQPEPHVDSWPGSVDQIFYRIYDLDGRLFVAQIDVGLLELSSQDELVELGAGELGGATEINAIFSLGEDSYLILTRLRGAFRLVGTELEAITGPASSWLRENQVQHGCPLPDSRFAVATRRGGVGILDRDLNLLNVLDEKGGLTHDSVSVVFLDRRGSLWAATENGINRVVIQTATAGFGASAGLPESAIAKIVPHRDDLYIATLDGLYRGERIETLTGPDVRFDPIALLKTQTWDLLPFDDEILAATTDGIFELRSRARTGVSLSTSNHLIATPALKLLLLEKATEEATPTRVVVGMAGGLGLLERDDGVWRFASRLQGLQHDVWDLAQGESGEIVAYLPDLSQIAILSFDAGFDREPKIYFHDSAGASELIRIDQQLFHLGDGDFWRYLGLDQARAGRAFETDPRLSKLTEFGIDSILLEDSLDRLWVTSERGLRIAKRLDSGGFKLRAASKQVLESPLAVFEDPVLKEIFWLGTVDGLVRITPQDEMAPRPAPPLLVRRVVALGTDRELDGGSFARITPPILEYGENALRFEFASPTYEQNLEMLYRVRLDGFEENWTTWSEESFKEYTSLAEGIYTFRAQAQDAQGTLGSVATWSFRILPPWYRTTWAFGSYFLGAIGFVLLLIRTRTGRLEKRRSNLEALIDARTVELASEKDQVERQARDLERVNLLLAEENEHRRQLEAERAKLNARAEQSQKLESLGLMAGGIAHDFNNILMAILGNTDLCLEDENLSQSLDRRLQAISDAGRRAAELCQQMLAYAGKGNFEERELDLSRLAGETLEILSVSIDSEITVQMDMASDLPAILGDPSKISQLVMNLLSNAAEAMGRGPGRLRLVTGTRHIDAEDQQTLVLADPIPEGPYVFLRVEDDGEGMDEETRRRIFDPFFTTKFAGRGLGMAAALGILRSHGGAISVKSERGEGTTVEAFFPALDHQVNESVPPTPEAVRRWRPGGTILIVDDEAVVRDVVELILRNTGFDVLAASSGQQGLEIYGAEKRRISAVILDLTMPGLDGLATFERLQLLDPEVKVLLSSGYSGDTLIDRYLERGFAGFIAKPYRPAALRQSLREILG